MEKEHIVESNGTVLPTEMVEIEAIKEPLFKKPRTTLQVIDTFEKGKIMRIQPQERTLAPPDGWMTRDDFREKFTFKVQPPESSVLHLQDITLNTEMKLQVKQPGQMVWTDVVYTSDLYRTHHRSTTGPIRTLPDDAEGTARGDEVPRRHHARFSCPLPVIHKLQLRMNNADRIDKSTDFDAFANYLRYYLNTTDAEKKDLELQLDENLWYDETMSRWGTFATAVDRDLVGLYRTEAELNAGDSGLKRRFRNILAMEDELKANGGIKKYRSRILNGFFEREELLLGWQNFELEVEISQDSLLAVSRAAADNGDGMVNVNCRVLYNMKETYLEYYYLQTENSENMETLIQDNQEFMTAEQMQLMISEPLPHPFDIAEGKELIHFTNVTSQTTGFPECGYFFVHPQKELRGEGYFGTDAFGIKPYHVTGINIKQNTESIWKESATIPWRPHHYDNDNQRVNDPLVKRMVLKMLMDADAPRTLRGREHRGSGNPKHLEKGGYVGYFNVRPQDIGMNGYVTKQRVDIKVHITADNTANAAADQPPSELVFVVAYSEPKKVINTDNAANRWNELQELETPPSSVLRSYSRFDGNYRRI